MSAGNKFVMDSRVPVSPSADKDDPSHPENVTKRAIMLQRQAHADTAQDIKAPIRNAPAAVTYDKKPGMMYELTADTTLNTVPSPLPPDLQEAFKEFTKAKTIQTSQAVCSAHPDCKAFVFVTSTGREPPVFYKKIGTPIPNRGGGSIELYTKKVPVEGFTTQNSTASPHILLLLFSILVGSVLIGVAVCYKLHIFYRFALAIGAMCAFRYAASVVQEPTTP